MAAIAYDLITLISMQYLSPRAKIYLSDLAIKRIRKSNMANNTLLKERKWSNP
jgi:hypothetical protein